MGRHMVVRRGEEDIMAWNVLRTGMSTVHSRQPVSPYQPVASGLFCVSRQGFMEGRRPLQPIPCMRPGFSEDHDDISHTLHPSSVSHPLDQG